MKSQIKFSAAFLLCAAPVLGQGYGGYGGSPMPSMPSAMDQGRSSARTQSLPWAKDQALVETLKDEIHSGGIVAVAPHVDDMERALANPQLTYSADSDGRTTLYMLADGQDEATAAEAALKTRAGMRIVPMDNPYPRLSLNLALYYNKIGKFDQALRVVDAGIKLSPIPDAKLGATLPALTVTRGAALGHLGRWQDQIDNENAGLNLPGMYDQVRAPLYLGRGFSQAQLGRLDEAEASYRESLKLTPDNGELQQELRNIQARRAAAGPQAPK